MSEIAVIAYLIGFAIVAGATFAFMWKMTTASLEALNKPIKRTRVPAPHPEMEGVQYGEELLIYTPKKEDEEVD
tara:strand:- start:220 stop:441 length:222 start_codon:yes stop_codon:yes gene_type:complete